MRWLSLAAILLCFAVMSNNASGAISSGTCHNCHTMHNSQDNAAMAQQYSSGTGALATDATPNPCLLSYDCVGCHFSSSTNTIVSNTPIVLNSQLPGSPLAGGNFYWALTDIKKGHNVYGISSQESAPMNAPPGFIASSTLPGGYGSGPAAWSTQLNCAGVYGCHGDRTKGSTAATVVEAVKGAHHETDTSIDGSTVGKSYRFMKGVTGVEMNDTGYKWEQTANSTHHNGYKGGSSPASVTNSISYFCGTCHGNFHGHTNLGGSAQVGSASPWFRHPSDLALSSVSFGYGGSEYAGYTVYSTTAPVALATPSTTISTVDSGSMVMCLSCHRAHGSPYYKLIRWDYKSTTLSTALTGCNVCHTAKN